MSTIALINQKGGCGKTTTVVNLGASLAGKNGRKTLLVDMDPQAHATLSVGIDPDQLKLSMYDVMTSSRKGYIPTQITDVIQHTQVDGLDIACSHIDLAGVEIEIASVIGRENMLKKALQPISRNYEYILIDCPPALGLLTLNSVVAADDIIIPVQTQYFSLVGMKQLFQVINAVKDELGHLVNVLGVLPTMFDRRTTVATEILDSIREYFGPKVMETTIRINVELVQSQMRGVPLFLTSPKSHGAQDYLALAQEVIRETGRNTKRH